MQMKNSVRCLNPRKCLQLLMGEGRRHAKQGKHEQEQTEAGTGPSRAVGLTEGPRPSTEARESKLHDGSRWKLNVATLGRRLSPAANSTCWVLLGYLARHWVARFSK